MRLPGKQKGVLAAAVGLASAIVAVPVASSAGTCGSGTNNCRATTRNYNIIADGAYANYSVANYTAPDYASGGFTAQVLWLGSNSGGNWCEVGWTKGWEGTGGFTHYHAQSQNGVYSEYKLSYAVGNPGTAHSYQMFRVPGQSFASIYIDVSFQAYCPIPVGANGYAQAGLEYTDLGAKAPIVNPHNLQWREYSTGTWRSWGYNSSPITQQLVGPASHYSYPSYPTSFNDWTSN